MEQTARIKTRPKIITSGTAFVAQNAFPTPETEDELPGVFVNDVHVDFGEEMTEEYDELNKLIGGRIQEEIDAGLALQMPITPESPSTSAVHQFEYHSGSSIVSPTPPKLPELVSSVLPIIPGYEAIKVTRRDDPEQMARRNWEQAIVRAGNNNMNNSVENQEIIQPEGHNNRISVVKDFISRKFPTELIPYKSPYWSQFRTALVLKRSREKSDIDNVFVSVRQDKQGKGFAMRNYVGVVIRNFENDVEEDDEPVKVSYVRKRLLRKGIFPTQYIPADSPYYASLLIGVPFPETGYKWIHRTGVDKVRMKFRIDSRRFVHVERNGVTVLLYSKYTHYKSSCRKKKYSAWKN